MPSEIARYRNIGYDCGMTPAHDGAWVSYSDYVAALASLPDRTGEPVATEVRAAVARIEKTLCPTFSSGAGDMGLQGRISKADLDLLQIAALATPPDAEQANHSFSDEQWQEIVAKSIDPAHPAWGLAATPPAPLSPRRPDMPSEIELREALKAAADTLESLSYIHDGNPSLAMADMPEADYARHMLFEARQMAREAHSEARAALASLPDRTGEPVAEDDEHFLTAYVSKDGHVVGIDHPTDANWRDVLRAHEVLRDRMNERIAEKDLCPFKPALATPPDAEQARLQEPVAELMRETLRDYRQTEVADEDGNGYPLVDALTLKGCGIDMGEREIDGIVDELMYAILPYLATPPDAGQARLREATDDTAPRS